MRPLLLLISLLFISCGIRKTELEVSKTNISASSSRTSDIDIKNDVKTNITVSSVEQTKDTEKDVEIIEEFGDNGQLKKRTYRKTSKQKERTKQKDSAASIIDNSAVKVKETDKNRSDSLAKTKDKKTTADKTVATNVGGAGWLYTLAITIAIILLFYFWLRKPVKKER